MPAVSTPPGKLRRASDSFVTRASSSERAKPRLFSCASPRRAADGKRLLRGTPGESLQKNLRSLGIPIEERSRARAAGRPSARLSAHRLFGLR